jgi:Sodium Bile acid symporter family
MAAVAHVLTALSNAAALLFVVTTMLAMGFSLTVSQIFAPLRSVRLVVLALVGNFVLVPLLAIALTRLIPLSEPLKIGVILLGVAAGQIRLVASTLSILWRRQQVWLRQHGAALVSGFIFFTIIAIYNLLWTRFTVPQTPDTWYGHAQYYLIYAWLLAVPQTVLNL